MSYDYQYDRQAILIFDDEFIYGGADVERHGTILIVRAGLSDDEIYEIVSKTDAWNTTDSPAWTPCPSLIMEQQL